MDIQELIEKAKEARKYAYVPYSRFPVGAALLTKDGEIYTGCNVENASYGLANCAERTAVFKAVSEGKREFKAIAVVGDEKALSFPCGACRQVLYEFGPDMDVIVANLEGAYKIMKITELLANAFGPNDLLK